MNLLITRLTEHEIINSKTIISSRSFTNPVQCTFLEIQSSLYFTICRACFLCALGLADNSWRVISPGIAVHCGPYKPPLAVPVCGRPALWEITVGVIKPLFFLQRGTFERTQKFGDIIFILDWYVKLEI